MGGDGDWHGNKVKICNYSKTWDTTARGDTLTGRLIDERFVLLSAHRALSVYAPLLVINKPYSAARGQEQPVLNLLTRTAIYNNHPTRRHVEHRLRGPRYRRGKESY